MMTTKRHNWLMFFTGIASLIAFVVILHVMSGFLPGPAGLIFHRNLIENMEVNAFFYSEVGNIDEFLDDESGKYGKNALEQGPTAGDEKRHVVR